MEYGLLYKQIGQLLAISRSPRTPTTTMTTMTLVLIQSQTDTIVLLKSGPGSGGLNYLQTGIQINIEILIVFKAMICRDILLYFFFTIGNTNTINR